MIKLTFYFAIWDGYDQQAPLNCRSLLQNIVSFIGLFCKRDLSYQGALICLAACVQTIFCVYIHTHAHTYILIFTHFLKNTFGFVMCVSIGIIYCAASPIGCLIFPGQFSTKEPYKQWLFCVASPIDQMCHLLTANCNTGWRRPIGCRIFTGQFPRKSPITSGSFAK